MVGMTRGMARKYGKYNITANCIGAGGIESEEAEGGLFFLPGLRTQSTAGASQKKLPFLPSLWPVNMPAM